MIFSIKKCTVIESSFWNLMSHIPIFKTCKTGNEFFLLRTKSEATGNDNHYCCTKLNHIIKFRVGYHNKKKKKCSYWLFTETDY